MQRRWMSFLVVLVLILAACGGDDSGEESSGASSEDSGESGGSGDSGDSGDSGESGDSEDSEDSGFSSLTGRQSDAVIKIDYVVGDDGDEMTIAYDGSTDPARASIRQGDSLTLAPGDGSSVQCDLGSDPPTCTESFLPGDFISFAAGLAFGGFGFLLTANDVVGGLDFIDVDESSDEIAGRSATCVTWDLSEIAETLGDIDGSDTGSFTGCLDDETGWPLRFVAVDGNGDTETEMQAVAVGEPNDSDFEAPVAVESLDEGLGELGEEFDQMFDDLGSELGDIEGLEDLDLENLDLEDLLGDIEIPDSSG